MDQPPRLRTTFLSIAALGTSLSAYALLLGMGLTVAAKVRALASLAQGGTTWGDGLGAVASDLLVYPLLALVITRAEQVRAWLRMLVVPLWITAFALAVVNAAYIAVAGDQITASVLGLGFDRIDQVADIAVLEAMHRAGYWAVPILIVLVGGYFVVRALFRRLSVSAEETTALRTRGLLVTCVLGAAIFGVAKAAALPRAFAAELLSDNAVLHTYMTWVDMVSEPIPSYPESLERHFALPTASADAVKEGLARTGTPNVLLVVLESTRYDHVQLPIETHLSSARTPNLLALARHGTFFTDAQATIPHTSKSLAAVLCGRLPAMEVGILEPADDVLHGCLPALLRDAGYATAFMQSAIGSFEYRPRLVTRLGFEAFEALETMGAAPTGYLAGDDRALGGAFDKWLRGVPQDKPFMAAVLTSGTHHPYALPPQLPLDDVQRELSRYAVMVELADSVVADLIRSLRDTGRLERTLIVALADHGEGLSGDPIRQHDNNFFDESLHVPVIIAGPGVAARRFDGLTSLMDVTPTLLGLLGVPHSLPSDELRFGIDVLRGPARRFAPFACWYDRMCDGYVSRDAKVVRMLDDRRTIVFDRSAGIDETRWRAPNAQESETLARVLAAQELTRLSLAPLQARALTLPSGFECGLGDADCVHPSRPEGGFHGVH